MRLDEAKQVLNDNGYILEDTETNDDEIDELTSEWKKKRDNRASDKELDDIFWKRSAEENKHMDLTDKMANAEKQLTYIKLKDVADLLDSYKCSYTFTDKDEFYQLYLKTSFNSFKIQYDETLNCYDIYYMFAEGYESFKTAEELVNWLFEDGE